MGVRRILAALFTLLVVAGVLATSTCTTESRVFVLGAGPDGVAALDVRAVWRR